MTPHEIKQSIIKGFLPYRCVAELWDYEDKIRFRVYDENNKPIITIPELEVNAIKNQSELESLIKFYKAEIKNLGFDID